VGRNGGKACTAHGRGGGRRRERTIREEAGRMPAEDEEGSGEEKRGLDVKAGRLRLSWKSKACRSFPSRPGSNKEGGR